MFHFSIFKAFFKIDIHRRPSIYISTKTIWVEHNFFLRKSNKECIKEWYTFSFYVMIPVIYFWETIHASFIGCSEVIDVDRHPHIAHFRRYYKNDIPMALRITALNPLLTHWSYCSLVLSHRNETYDCMGYSEWHRKTEVSVKQSSQQ